MTGRAAEVLAVAGAAGLLTVVLAIPVMHAPFERIFGMETVGRHYDPFTVMEQFSAPVRWTAYLQPVTDLPGHILAAWVGPVAAYNIVVLTSFPLLAAAVYLLARHCALGPGAATGAAFAVAFSPFHIAHAAYHPHVAQLQWLPLYLLALWRCLDRPALKTVAILTMAIAAVVFSNFYGGFIAAVITPVAAGAYWWVRMKGQPGAMRRVGLTSLVLITAAAVGVAYAVTLAAAQTPVDFMPGDFQRYSATWWRYLAPPVANPWLGSVLRTADTGLLEQQVSVGWGIVTLGVVAIVARLRERGPASTLSNVPLFAAIALFAFWCSTSASTMLAGVVPMFRSYARFGAVVQLMMVLLAALGAQWLWRSHGMLARGAVVALTVLTVLEYAVWPPALWRDVLPTSAHRWVMTQTRPVHVFDCYDYSRESESIQWLTEGRVILRERSVSDCREPGVIARLAATGFTHMLVRRLTPEGKWFEGRTPPAGLRLAQRFNDAEVFEVTQPASLIRTIGTDAFDAAEFDDREGAWRWMGAQASWTVWNSSARVLLASVDLELRAFHETRHLAILLDGAVVQEIAIAPERAMHRVGPLTLPPGSHTLGFRSGALTMTADDVLRNGDPRRLSVAFGDWRWSVEGER